MRQMPGVPEDAQIVAESVQQVQQVREEIMDTALEQQVIDFGPSKFGVNLLINPEGVPDGKTAVIDVETDEKDSFVGIGIMCDPHTVRYYSSLTPDLHIYLSNTDLIGHNLKGDAHWLKTWGITINSNKLKHDTMLKSYVRNSTKESHGLKDLAKEYLNMEWPTYDQMTVNGTLDMMPVEQVAAYCGDDCVGTYRLNEYFDRVMTSEQKGYYNNLELPIMQLLFDMEDRGVTVDVEYFKALREDFQKDATSLLIGIKDLVASSGFVPLHRKSCPKKLHTHEFNPGSPKQVLEVLNFYSIPVTGTAKGDLEAYRSNELVNLLLEYRKISKVIGTFLDAWLELSTLPKIHTTFSQVSFDEGSGDWKGIRTGRLSSKSPNLQQISKAGDDNEETTGKALRSGFIASPGKELLVFDFDQFQYRILAHYTKEPVLLEAFKRGEDVHEATGKALFGKTSITKQERSIAKNCNFGAVFGAQAEKIAAVAKCSVEDAEKFLATYWKRLPGVTLWINRTKMLAHVHKSVKTILGRVIPLPGIDSRNVFDRMHAERTAVNYVIQGGEADIIKLGMLQVKAKGYMPILQVHDELHFEVDPSDRENAMKIIQSTLESIVKLDVPIFANGGYGANWFLAK
jgi:DNA polymerase I